MAGGSDRLGDPLPRCPSLPGSGAKWPALRSPARAGGWVADLWKYKNGGAQGGGGGTAVLSYTGIKGGGGPGDPSPAFGRYRVRRHQGGGGCHRV